VGIRGRRLANLPELVRVSRVTSERRSGTCLLSASSDLCLSQELEDFPESALSAEQWQQRVQEARCRSEKFVANARTRTADLPRPDKEDAEAADQRAMNDPTLRRGDIIATSLGFVVFVGREGEEDGPHDFLPAQHPR
jgi:hypothetical protein